jgi:hypothetical protein
MIITDAIGAQVILADLARGAHRRMTAVEHRAATVMMLGQRDADLLDEIMRERFGAHRRVSAL